MSIVFAPGFRGRGAPATLTYTGATYQSATGDGGTTWTSGSLSFGTATADRRVIVAFGFDDGNSGNRTVSTATIGGVSATILKQSHGNRTCAAILMAAVPTGATGVVAITMSGSIPGSAGVKAANMAVYAAYGLKSDTPVATTAAGPVASGSIDLSLSSSSGGGFALALINDWNTSSPAWTGFSTTRDFTLTPVSGIEVSATSGSTSGGAITWGFGATTLQLVGVSVAMR